NMRIGFLALFIFIQMVCLRAGTPDPPLLFPPDISVEGGTLNCFNPQIQIHGSSNTPGVTFEWSGPGGFQSSLPDPVVGTPGGYILTVTAPDGSTAAAVAVVEADFEQPNVYAAGGYLPCTEDSIQLKGQSDSTILSWNWQGPNGFVSNEQNPWAYEPGAYILTVTAQNGCQKSAQGNVILTGEVPQITISGDTVLNCSKDTTTLTGTTDLADATFKWTRPDGSEIASNTLSVNLPGTYVFSATSTDGCTVSIAQTVAADTLPPDLLVLADTLTCLHPATVPTVVTADSIVSFLWSNNNGFSSSAPQPTLSLPDSYTLSVVGINGCETAVSFTLAGDLDAPAINLSGDTLNCKNDSVLVAAAVAPPTLGDWSGPNGMSVSNNDFYTQTPGWYTFTATGQNGCSATDSVLILSDFASPVFSAAGGEITCAQDSVILTATPNAGQPVWYWSGPNGFSSDQPNPTTTQAGTYYITATGQNGCSATDTVLVLDKKTPPDILAKADTLNCATPQIALSAQSNTPDLDYWWEGPNGFQSPLPAPLISEGGTYALTVTAANGCTAQTSVFIASDFAEPTISVEADSLTCANPSLSFSPTTNPPDVAFFWVGPNNFESNDPNPVISMPGDYFVTVTAPNGCTNVAAVEITSNQNPPDFTLFPDTLTCTKASLTLSVNTNLAGGIYEWQGPGGFMSSEPNPVISAGGLYTLTLTDANGCQKTDAVFIATDTLSPVLSVSGGT
ncbi:MAG: hypothetical protein D6714_04235, partial [Bacteroidetes bacterium]